MYKKYLIERIFLKIYYFLTSMYFQLVHGIKIGKNCKLSFKATLRGNIVLGDNITIDNFSYLCGNISVGDNTNIGSFSQLSTMPDGKIEIGKDCHINSFNIIGSSKKVVIGDYALFAVGVKITDASHGIENAYEIIKQASFQSQEINIGKNCWLGFDVNVIMGGGIGDNCVIGSQSLVNAYIQANTISVGTPSKVIKKREFIEK